MNCPKCGAATSPGSAVCGRCGSPLAAPAPSPPPPGPAPYAPPPQQQGWPQQPGYGAPYAAPGYAPAPYAMVPVGPMPLAPFQCRVCGYAGHAMMVQKISTAGWIVFTLLLLFCLPLFWIGLLMKETRCQCPSCRVMY